MLVETIVVLDLTVLLMYLVMARRERDHQLEIQLLNTRLEYLHRSLER